VNSTARVEPADSIAERPNEQWRTLAEVAEAATERLSVGERAYLEGGSGGEQALRANRAAFERWSLLPAPLSGCGKPDTRASIVGIELAVPFVAGPVGPYSVFDPDGDIAVARAAEVAGTVVFVPVLSAQTLEETRHAAPGGAKIFQILASGSEAAALGLVARAADAGYEAICITIDAFPRSYRDRVDRTGFEIEAALFSANYGDDAAREIEAHVELTAFAWDWRALERIVAASRVPVIVKGVLTPRAARAAVDCGAAAIVVSNVGGRQLEAAPSALSQLASIVEAVGEETEVLLDSGVRRGVDVVKALALGARCVLLGRVVARGLAAGGERGVLRSLEILRREVETCMSLCGAGDISAIDSTILTPVQ
jgi:isopentenyl diphosphate isomerase/L-lactate dehydrogenase-like FMN-dependent dehydrogenase